MQTNKEKMIILEEKRLEVIKNLKKLPGKCIREYNNNEIDNILYDIENELNHLYSDNTTGFGLRLENDIMLYIFAFGGKKYALIDSDGETIGSVENNINEELLVALMELYRYCEEEVSNREYNKSMAKFNKILESI